MAIDDFYVMELISFRYTVSVYACESRGLVTVFNNIKPWYMEASARLGLVRQSLIEGFMDLGQVQEQVRLMELKVKHLIAN